MPEDIVNRLRTTPAMAIAQNDLPLLEEAGAEIMRLREAARAMLAALQTMRLQLHVALAGKEALSIEKQLSIIDAAIIQAEAAGITAPETRHARDCAYVTTSGPAPCTCAAGIKAEG